MFSIFSKIRNIKKTSKKGFLKTKKGVTLMELLIALSILGVGLISIIKMLNGGLDNVDRMRQEIIAINLAREGVEGVYNIRNTNRTRRAGVKDKCRLKTDPLNNEGGDNDCTNDTRMQKGNYILKTKQKNGQKYFILSGLSITGLDMSKYDIGVDDQYSLCYSGNSRISCPGQMETISEGRFFRQIEGKGLFLKDVNIDGGQLLNCSKGTDTDGGILCGGNRAKEFRFCSKVQYLKKYLGTIELCATLNNFEK